MNPKCESCPMTGECKSYEHLCRRYKEDPAKWQDTFDRVNGVVLEYPPLINQVQNFAKSMLRFAKSGFKTVDEEEYNRRLSICNQCVHLNRKDMKCTLCGCPVHKKAIIYDEPCPANKWGDGHKCKSCS